jgi:GT2 family glycosyltransferase
MKKVSVIIINYNSSEYTIACIRSIIDLTPVDLPYEIIVVDNNSQIADFENLSNNIPDFHVVKLIKSKINLGFAGGNTLAMNYSDAQYVFFLNNDCLLLNDNLGILCRFMEENPDAGTCTAQMYSCDKPFHHSFNYFTTLKLNFHCLINIKMI